MKPYWGVMVCTDTLTETVSMYRQMFDAEPRDLWPGCHAFESDNGRFVVMEAPDTPPFLIQEVGDLDAQVARLREAGFEVQEPFDIRLGRFCFYSDRKGNPFGLIQPSD